MIIKTCLFFGKLFNLSYVFQKANGMPPFLNNNAECRNTNSYLFFISTLAYAAINTVAYAAINTVAYAAINTVAYAAINTVAYGSINTVCINLTWY